jgi:hypothetical protein
LPSGWIFVKFAAVILQWKAEKRSLHHSKFLVGYSTFDPRIIAAVFKAGDDAPDMQEESAH